jgi:flagellar basal-body rod protein FlgF
MAVRRLSMKAGKNRRRGPTEGSNVNAAEQMVTMISLARQFEMQMKVLSTADANDRAATQILALR